MTSYGSFFMRQILAKRRKLTCSYEFHVKTYRYHYLAFLRNESYSTLKFIALRLSRSCEKQKIPR